MMLDPCTEYRSVHYRLFRDHGPASLLPCSKCGDEGSRHDWSYQYPTNGSEKVCPITGRKYSNDTGDYLPMCRRCHANFDSVQDPDLAARLSEARKDAMTGRPKTPEQVRKIWAARHKALEDPETGREYSERYRRKMIETNSRKIACKECQMQTNPGNMGKHQTATGHRGTEEVMSDVQ